MIEKTVLLQRLCTDWVSYLSNYLELSPSDQHEYIAHQGYARFADLLAHFTAWWERGMGIIETARYEPGYLPPEVEVDDFNAATLARVHSLTEAEVLTAFEDARYRFIDLVKSLSDEELGNPKINWQLEIELIGHLREHAFSDNSLTSS